MTPRHCQVVDMTRKPESIEADDHKDSSLPKAVGMSTL